jgi:hypothetical protein
MGGWISALYAALNPHPDRRTASERPLFHCAIADPFEVIMYRDILTRSNSHQEICIWQESCLG